MEAIDKLKQYTLYDLVQYPGTSVFKEVSLGKLQGKADCCDEIYSLQVFRLLDNREDQ
jgi:hypothetical protein